MARVRSGEYLSVSQNDTRPIEFDFNLSDGQTATDLTDASVWVSFWYQDADFHCVRPAVCGGATGIATYYPDGTEFPTAGKDVFFKATAEIMHLAGLGTNRAWIRISHPIQRWRVLPTP